jgi:hypothetical protein
MTEQLICDTLAYVRKELNRLEQDIVWADGAEGLRMQTRRTRLQSELSRLELLRTSAESADEN